MAPHLGPPKDFIMIEPWMEAGKQSSHPVVGSSQFDMLHQQFVDETSSDNDLVLFSMALIQGALTNEVCLEERAKILSLDWVDRATTALMFYSQGLPFQAIVLAATAGLSDENDPLYWVASILNQSAYPSEQAILVATWTGLILLFELGFNKLGHLQIFTYANHLPNPERGFFEREFPSCPWNTFIVRCRNVSRMAELAMFCANRPGQNPIYLPEVLTWLYRFEHESLQSSMPATIKMQYYAVEILIFSGVFHSFIHTKLESLESGAIRCIQAMKSYAKIAEQLHPYDRNRIIANEIMYNTILGMATTNGLITGKAYEEAISSSNRRGFMGRLDSMGNHVFHSNDAGIGSQFMYQGPHPQNGGDFTLRQLAVLSTPPAYLQDMVSQTRHGTQTHFDWPDNSF